MAKKSIKASQRKRPGFHLWIETDSSAFAGDHRAGSPAVVSLLRKVCIALGSGKTVGYIKDVNSKTVGRWRYEKQRAPHHN